jgi:ribosome-binding protein aMBF1 (putative translation factor)
VVSVRCPDRQVPRTLTVLPFVAAMPVDAKAQLEVHCYGRLGKRLVSHAHHRRHALARKPKPVSAEVAERLAKAAREARDAEDAWKLAVQQRDAIVVEAVDVHGMSQNAIANAIGVVPGRIHGILVNSQPDAGS